MMKVLPATDFRVAYMWVKMTNFINSSSSYRHYLVSPLLFHWDTLLGLKQHLLLLFLLHMHPPLHQVGLSDGRREEDELGREDLEFLAGQQQVLLLQGLLHLQLFFFFFAFFLTFLVVVCSEITMPLALESMTTLVPLPLLLLLRRYPQRPLPLVRPEQC
jgi:hypothetical protein